MEDSLQEFRKKITKGNKSHTMLHLVDFLSTVYIYIYIKRLNYGKKSKLFCFCNTLEHLLKSALFRISLAFGLFSVLNKSVATVALWQCKPVPEQPVDYVSIPWRGPELGRSHHLAGFTPKSIQEAGSPTRVRNTV